jgi:hypothetical protein
VKICFFEAIIFKYTFLFLLAMRIAILFMVLLLMSSFVVAGESIDLDFDDGRTQAVNLYEGDEVRFELVGGTHSVILNDISRGKDIVKIRIVPFLNDEINEIWPALITLDMTGRVDINGDGTPDLNIALYSVEEDGRANFVFQKIVESDNEITGESVGLVEPDTPENPNKNKILVVLGVLVLVLIGLFVFRKQLFVKNDKPERSEENYRPYVADKAKEDRSEEKSEDSSENDSS